MNATHCRQLLFVVTCLVALSGLLRASQVERVERVVPYADGRPAAEFRLNAIDAGVVLRHGDGPGGCDRLGARDVWVWEHEGSYFMHYDGAGDRGWLGCLAVSTDLNRWVKHGPILDLGAPGADDSASASYPTTFFSAGRWHMFYLGTPNTSGAPELVPSFPYLTLKADAPSPRGPWTKRRAVVPFRTVPHTFYDTTASPGHIVPHRGEFLMFFSASTDRPTLRTIGLARTKDLDGPWQIEARPIVPATEQIENTSLYFESETGTWWLFTNHVGVRDGLEYTDAIWVYWTKDLEHWDPAHKAVVLDSQNCQWSPHIIGVPSVVKVGRKLALFYDGNGEAKLPQGVASHMRRDVGLAWLDLPLRAPVP